MSPFPWFTLLLIAGAMVLGAGIAIQFFRPIVRDLKKRCQVTEEYNRQGEDLIETMRRQHEADQTEKTGLRQELDGTATRVEASGRNQAALEDVLKTSQARMASLEVMLAANQDRERRLEDMLREAYKSTAEFAERDRIRNDERVGQLLAHERDVLTRVGFGGPPSVPPTPEEMVRQLEASGIFTDPEELRQRKEARNGPAE